MNATSNFERLDVAESIGRKELQELQELQNCDKTYLSSSESDVDDLGGHCDGKDGKLLGS